MFTQMANQNQTFVKSDDLSLIVTRNNIKLAFMGTTNTTLTEYASNETVYGSNNTNMTINLVGSQNDTLKFSHIHGNLTIKDFNDSDTLSLRGTPFHTTADEFSAIKTIDAHTQQLTIPGNGGATVTFIDSHFTAANLVLGH